MSSEWELDEGIKSIKSAWRREHTARANLEKMLEQAEAENTKLREELVDAPKCDACEAMLDCDECLRADGSHKERRRLKAENTKLRELVADMWEGYNDPRCEDCPLKDTPTCADCPICAREAAVIDRMRELGVEVGDA